jgi:hypothetical protein
MEYAMYAFDRLAGWIILIILFLLYFLPSIIALLRKKDNTVGIIVLNLLLGWTFIGWMGAFVWALTANPRRINFTYINPPYPPQAGYPPYPPQQGYPGYPPPQAYPPPNMPPYYQPYNNPPYNVNNQPYPPGPGFPPPPPNPPGPNQDNKF